MACIKLSATVAINPLKINIFNVYSTCYLFLKVWSLVICILQCSLKAPFFVTVVIMLVMLKGSLIKLLS